MLIVVPVVTAATAIATTGMVIATSAPCWMSLIAIRLDFLDPACVPQCVVIVVLKTVRYVTAWLRLYLTLFVSGYGVLYDLHDFLFDLRLVGWADIVHEFTDLVTDVCNPIGFAVVS